MLGKARAWMRDQITPAQVKLRENYSQYAEDAMFFKALNPTGPGFYVDVGAHDPVWGSNTYRLYKHGWQGVTVEPNPDKAASFLKVRPRDHFINAGVSDAPGDLAYYEYEYPEINTFSSDRKVWLEKEQGRIPTRTRSISTRPLADMLSEVIIPHIDFLTIDCEGFDEMVLRTANLDKLKPTVVLVEDWDRYNSLRSGGAGGSSISQFLIGMGYEPVAQCVLSTLYVAKDWERLFSLSKAFDRSAVQKSIFPVI